MALMAGANVHSEITETMFENRMRHVSELNRMGARIELDGPTALIDGAHLRGASVEACDLRAGAALAVAAVGAMGTTRLHGAQIIRRGYENLDGKLVSMGADIAVKGDGTRKANWRCREPIERDEAAALMHNWRRAVCGEGLAKDKYEYLCKIKVAATDGQQPMPKTERMCALRESRAVGRLPAFASVI